MKQYKIVVICMCILLLLAGGTYAQQKTVRILAIGNSFSQDAVGGVNLQFAKETDKNIMAALDVFWRESHVQTVIHLFVFVSNEKNIRQQPQNTRFGNVPLGIAYRK